MIKYGLSLLTKKLQRKYGPGYAIYCQQGRRRQIRAIFWVHYLEFFEHHLVGMKAAVLTDDGQGGFYSLDVDKPGEILDIKDDWEAAASSAKEQAVAFLLEIETELNRTGTDFEVDGGNVPRLNAFYG